MCVCEVGTTHGISSLAAYLNCLGIVMHADFDSLAQEWGPGF